ncbi:inner-membrane translocator [Streptomyces shenzhenensis]|uniref:inner-membrane translocator n=1 Tax=Streptomyces shenzhenensis TaxID=943815 RepID=UPI0037F27165
MPELTGQQPSEGKGARTAGCLLLLVLVAAGSLVLIVLAARGPSRMNAGSGPAPAGAPPADWTPALCFGASALAVCVTGVMLLRLGHRYIGAIQLGLCVVMASLALGARR